MAYFDNPESGSGKRNRELYSYIVFTKNKLIFIFIIYMGLNTKMYHCSWQETDKLRQKVKVVSSEHTKLQSTHEDKVCKHTGLCSFISTY